MHRTLSVLFWDATERLKGFTLTKTTVAPTSLQSLIYPNTDWLSESLLVGALCVFIENRWSMICMGEGRGPNWIIIYSHSTLSCVILAPPLKGWTKRGCKKFINPMPCYFCISIFPSYMIYWNPASACNHRIHHFRSREDGLGDYCDLRQTIRMTGNFAWEISSTLKQKRFCQAVLGCRGTALTGIQAESVLPKTTDLS